jgi:hypothetical protein
VKIPNVTVDSLKTVDTSATATSDATVATAVAAATSSITIALSSASLKGSGKAPSKRASYVEAWLSAKRSSLTLSSEQIAAAAPGGQSVDTVTQPPTAASISTASASTTATSTATTSTAVLKVPPIQLTPTRRRSRTITTPRQLKIGDAAADNNGKSKSNGNNDGGDDKPRSARKSSQPANDDDVDDDDDAAAAHTTPRSARRRHRRSRAATFTTPTLDANDPSPAVEFRKLLQYDENTPPAPKARTALTTTTTVNNKTTNITTSTKTPTNAPSLSSSSSSSKLSGGTSEQQKRRQTPSQTSDSSVTREAMNRSFGSTVMMSTSKLGRFSSHVVKTNQLFVAYSDHDVDLRSKRHRCSRDHRRMRPRLRSKRQV